MKKEILYIILGVILLSVKGMGQAASISISGSNLYTYNGSPQAESSVLTITYTFGGSDFPNSSVTYTYSGPSYSSTNIAPSVAGTYQVIASVNFSITGLVNSIPFAFTIAKATPTLSVTNPTLTYTANTQSATLSSSVDGSRSNIKYNGSSTLPINAGTYTITADFAPTDASNYNSLTGEIAGNFTINKAPVTISDIVLTKVYDGTPTVNVISNSSSGTISSDNVAIQGSATNFSDKIVGNNYTSTVTYNLITIPSTGKENNYYITGSNPVLITNGSITKLPITLTASANTKVYDGTVSANATPTLTIGTLASGDVGVYSETYDTKNQGINKVLTPTATILDASNTSMTGNYSITYASVNTGVITKLPITLIASPNTKVYDGTLSATATPTLTGTLVTGDVGVYSETYDTKSQGINKILTPSVISILDATNASMTGNYSITYGTNTNGVITKLPITITANTNTKVYDGTLSSTATPTLTGTLASGDIGVYSQTFDTKGQGTNKTLTPTAIILDATNASMTGNYSITYASVNTGIIAKKPITITATAGQTKVYGGSDPTSYAYTLSAALVSSDVLTGALTRAAGETVGPYAISQGTLTNANYDIAFVASNFTITKKPLTITATAGQTKVYGGSDPTSYAYTLSAALVSSDVLTGALTRAAGETVGPYAISQGTLTNANYDITFVGSDFNITKAPLTITAKPHTITYNGTAYAGGNGVVPTGLISGETISNLTGTLNYAGTSQGAKNVDTYTILPNGLSSTNYNINYVEGALEIRKATLKVIAGDQSVNAGTPKAKILTDASVTYSGLVGGDNPSDITGSVTYFTNYEPTFSKGASGIFIDPIITSLSAANYNLIAVKGTITITAPPNFQIPNAFTPNSDGHNDTFKMIQNGYIATINKFKFSVYTKSGKLIFFTDKIGEGWDGRYGGVMLESDVYYWIIEVTKINGVNDSHRGTFLLLK